MRSQTRVVLNISGQIFETLDQTLRKYPKTLLGDESKRARYLCRRTNQFFFDRNRQAFEAILFFYQSSGTLIRPPLMNMCEFERECIFFQLPDSSINAMKSKEGVFYEDTHDDDDYSVLSSVGGIHVKLWNILENPETSVYAMAFAIVSLIMIFVSVFVACLETVPSIHVLTKISNRFKDPWFLIELSLNSWFLLELSARFIFSPNKLRFLRSTLNVMDILAVVPYFFVLSFDNDVSSLAFLRILRFFRVFRLFRLSKHSRRMQVIGEILKSSITDLQQLFLCLLILVVFGGSMLYFAERDTEDNQFKSIPDSLWWAIQTVVVLGYGDTVPVTVTGKILATGFMLFGALTIALPVLSIVMKFTSLYHQNIQESE